MDALMVCCIFISPTFQSIYFMLNWFSTYYYLLLFHYLSRLLSLSWDSSWVQVSAYVTCERPAGRSFHPHRPPLRPPQHYSSSSFCSRWRHSSRLHHLQQTPLYMHYSTSSLRSQWRWRNSCRLHHLHLYLHHLIMTWWKRWCRYHHHPCRIMKSCHHLPRCYHHPHCHHHPCRFHGAHNYLVLVVILLLVGTPGSSGKIL